MKKVILVQPHDDSTGNAAATSYRNKVAPSTALAILACETERRCGSAVSLETHQPEEIDFAFIEACARADVLGIGNWYSNHLTGMGLARVAKEVNPDLVVAVGGVNASHLGQRILANQPAVDFVCCGDGEDALWRIIDGQEPSLIPNLWHRQNGSARFSYQLQADLDAVGVWDFRHSTGVQLDEWNEELNTFSRERQPFGLSMVRGCHKAARLGRCSFCSCVSEGVRSARNEMFWLQIGHLTEMYGCRHYFETGDDFPWPAYARELIVTRPRSLESTKFRVYLDPWAVTEKTAELYAKLGLHEAFIGFESSSEEILSRANKPVKDPVSRLNEAIRLLHSLDPNIMIKVPVMFGLPGETLETAEATAQAISSIIESHENVVPFMSLALPVVGTAWHNELVQDKAVQRDYAGDLSLVDHFDYRALLGLSLRKYGGPSLGKLEGIRDKMYARFASFDRDAGRFDSAVPQ